MTNHCMLDLETLGSTPGCVVLSIGAVIFDPTAGTVCSLAHANANPIFPQNLRPLSVVVNLKSAVSAGLKIDPETLEWWMRQDRGARLATLGKPGESHILVHALTRFADWYRNSGAQRIWCHGATFDVPVLGAAYAALGMDVPWEYRTVRDTRTAFELARCGDVLEQVEMRFGGTKHVAADDAGVQAAQVCEAYRCLGQGPGWSGMGHVDINTKE